MNQGVWVLCFYVRCFGHVQRSMLLVCPTSRLAIEKAVPMYAMKTINPDIDIAYLWHANTTTAINRG
ncbi:MAG TPA: hypothetical protein DET40_07820 [Lentisphaeria bacterium]|nr:MAG: hypothetical protein A2X45_11795 [Lentisphaerae bacterium GWF2_50_93]HCE43441.1 hypothetical protein [Lentisphaeria bacterium]